MGAKGLVSFLISARKVFVQVALESIHFFYGVYEYTANTCVLITSCVYEEKIFEIIGIIERDLVCVFASDFTEMFRLSSSPPQSQSQSVSSSPPVTASFGRYFRSIFVQQRTVSTIDEETHDKEMHSIMKSNRITNRRRSLSESDVTTTYQAKIFSGSESYGSSNKWLHRLSASFRKKVLKRKLLRRQHTINVIIFDHYHISKWLIKKFFIEPIKNRLVRVTVKKRTLLVFQVFCFS